MNKKTPNLLRSLSVILCAAVLAGSFPSDMQTVSAESADIDFVSSPEEETSPDVEFTEETIDDTQESASDNTESASDFSYDTEDGLFSSEEDSLFTSGDSSVSADDDLDYILGRPMTEEERQAQLAPLQNLKPMTPLDDVDSDLSSDIATYAVLPEVYDSRDENLVTPVKFQNPFGICWAFSLISNAETSLLSQGLGCWDLSEEHLAYFFTHRTDDPLGNTPNDKYIHKGSDYHDSGNGMIASFFLSTWSGMTTEDKVPLPTDSTHTRDFSASMVPDSSLAYDTSVYMENAVFSQYEEERTKLLLSQYGSVSAMIYMDSSGRYYNPDTAASCYPSSGSVNHAVTLVGWNDHYSKENFTSASGVQNNGAWIVKNSYDTDWGDNGYFYISYEDQSLRNLICNTATTAPAYPNNYFYDGANSSTTTFTLKTGYSIANIFTAKVGKGNYEQLGEIVTASKTDNASYQIQIYTDLTDPKDPASGVPAYAAPFELSLIHI